MKWVAVLAVSGLFFCVQGSSRRGLPRVPYDDDHQCIERNGTCQDESSSCNDGIYVTGFCGGPYNRRCCVPIGNSGCLWATEQLACNLLQSSSVRAARRHPSGQRDNAYAYNNLRDMCRGQKASRSSYYCRSGGCNAPGGSTCLSFKLLKYLNDLTNDWGTVRINELAGACHSCNSRHYLGQAVDLHKNGRESEYIQECRNHGGVPVNEPNHVHCQFYSNS